jgi:hypothetical protein
LLKGLKGLIWYLLVWPIFLRNHFGGICKAKNSQ